MIRRIIPIFIAFVALVPSAIAQSLRLGVLEDVPGVYAGEQDSRRVRIVFQKNGGDWSAFPSDCDDEACLKTITVRFPRTMTWNIGFNRRSLERLTAHTPDDFKFYAHVGLQDITSKTPIPTVGKKSTEFSGFTGEPVYRPLIANSQQFFKDPDGWKPTVLPTPLLETLRRGFRERFPDVKNCTSPEENIAKPWRYGDQNIELMKAYSSRIGWSLAELVLKEDRCDGPPDDPFDGQWFVINPEGHLSFLGQDMWLVDAGDYDGDGKSEVVFAIDGYDRGGYELFYDDFKKHVSFEFGYH